VRIGDFKSERAADPETYYITDHYINYEWILFRLSRVRRDAPRGLFRGARRSAVANKRRSSPRWGA